jgi:Fic family protein
MITAHSAVFMHFIHADPDWPNFLWNAEALSTSLAAMRFRQGQLLGRMSTLAPELRAQASLTTLTSDVVQSSALGGESLPPDEVRSSIARQLGLETAGLPQSGRGVDGMVEMMLDATQRHTKPLTRQRLFSWHTALFPTGHSGTHRITTGAWRTAKSGLARVVSGPVGRERVHFEAPDAARIDTEMAAFLEWFNSAPAIDPVLVAGTAHLWFVTIHPFEDGNGRIARAVADMALARADDTHERFYSMSARIKTERKAYYQQLEATQRGDLDISPWLEWFIACLDRAITDADITLAAVLQRADLWQRAQRHLLNERQRLVLERMTGDFEGFLTNAKYAKLAKCSPDSALRDIRELLQWGLLSRNSSGGRSTSYTLRTSAC